MEKKENQQKKNIEMRKKLENENFRMKKLFYFHFVNTSLLGGLIERRMF